jgi:hypothetical protein
VKLKKHKRKAEKSEEELAAEALRYGMLAEAFNYVHANCKVSGGT